MEHVTVVGGGIGGLVTAIAAREAGMAVTLHEAHDRLGGRAWTTSGERRANWGPHVVYCDGPLWRWLDARDLAEPASTFPKTGKLLVREDGRARRVPSRRVTKALLKLRRATHAPVERSFHDWALSEVGDEEAVAKLSSFIGVATFHHDPGSLSAAFIVERLRRATAFPPTVRYVQGGWGSIVERLAAHARGLGVTIETSSPVDVLPEGLVVLALPLRAASALLGEDVTWTGARTALLDLAVERRRGDPFVLADLDQCGWVESYSMADRTLAPRDEHLVQAQIGMRPDETLDEAIARVERLIDTGFEGWRARVRWRRQAKIENESGAVDLPGTSWRDRPAIDRGDGVYLVGDMVAAPGLLAEVSHVSALTAVADLRERLRASSAA